MSLTRIAHSDGLWTALKLFTKTNRGDAAQDQLTQHKDKWPARRLPLLTGLETHIARKRVPVTQSTILSSSAINCAYTLTIELIQPNSMPALVRIVWPTSATITTL